MQRILEQEHLIAAKHNSQNPYVLNDMHKANNKASDGIVLVEHSYNSGLFDERTDSSGFNAPTGHYDWD